MNKGKRWTGLKKLCAFVLAFLIILINVVGEAQAQTINLAIPISDESGAAILSDTVNVNISSEIDINMKADGSNEISEYSVFSDTNSLYLRSIQIESLADWHLIDHSRTPEQKEIKLYFNDSLIVEGENDIQDIHVEKGETYVPELKIERGAISESETSEAFRMVMEYDVVQNTTPSLVLDHIVWGQSLPEQLFEFSTDIPDDAYVIRYYDQEGKEIGKEDIAINVGNYKIRIEPTTELYEFSQKEFEFEVRPMTVNVEEELNLFIYVGEKPDLVITTNPILKENEDYVIKFENTNGELQEDPPAYSGTFGIYVELLNPNYCMANGENTQRIGTVTLSNRIPGPPILQTTNNLDGIAFLSDHAAV